MNDTARKAGDAAAAFAVNPHPKDVFDWTPELLKKKRPVMRPDAIAVRVAEMQQADISLSRMAVESGVARQDLDAWISGARNVETTGLLSTWIQDIDEELAAAASSLVRTPTAARILNGLEKAREPRGSEGRRGIAYIGGASGTSKTTVAKWLESVDGGVVHLQLNGETKTYVSILKGVLAKRGHSGFAATGEATTDAILRFFKRGDLIILDHAQLLQMRVIEQLTVFPDEHGIGLALIGNVAGYKAMVDMKTKQILSRVGGALVHVDIPSAADVDCILEAEKVFGRKEREFCHIIGCQDGGLRYLYETFREARKLQRPSGQEHLDVRFLKLGAANAGHWGA